MSGPPGTWVRFAGNPVFPGTTIYSLVFALIIEGTVPYSPLGQRFGYDLSRGSANHRNAITTRFKQPADLFRHLGPPIFPPPRPGFLLGWRAGVEHTVPRAGVPPGEPIFPPVPWRPAAYSHDPRRCAGVLSRCYGTVYLPDRAPDLSWDRLLAQPIAFDEPLFPSP